MLISEQSTKDKELRTQYQTKIPAPNSAGLQQARSFCGPSYLADCFTWPQVALTHHVCQLCLYARENQAVKHVA